MPGRSINTTERRLLEFWQNPPATWDKPLLRSLEVEGGTGLRGIDGLVVPFRYPLTAICGGNGAGKSTILALAALAHHSPPDWHFEWNQPTTGARSRQGSYYRFSDFFLRGEGDGEVDNLSITWRYMLEGGEVYRRLTKRTRGWSSYNVRPQRATVFVPISRILPAFEVARVRTLFGKGRSGWETDLLDGQYRRKLSFIMGREYKNAEIQRHRRHSFQRCESGSVYTAFNMGSGESCMIALLYVLQRIPRGGLIVAEELELGLHPQAQVRLAETLLEECQAKRLQIVCSTHSEAFLDALPRQARLLIRRGRDGHSLLEAPSTRFAIYEMTGEARPEVTIYCEDHIAAILIHEALPSDLRVRVSIRDVGNHATVIRQGVSHLRSGLSNRVLCVLDGDTCQSDIDGWVRSESNGKIECVPDIMSLPGNGLAPEKWILEQIKHEEYQDEFAKQMSCPLREARAHIDALEVELDHHDIGYVLHRRTSIDEVDCVRRTMRAFALRHPQLDVVRDQVRRMLN